MLETTTAVRSHVCFSCPLFYFAVPRQCRKGSWSHEMLLGAPLPLWHLVFDSTRILLLFTVALRDPAGSRHVSMWRAFFFACTYSMLCKNSCSGSAFFREIASIESRYTDLWLWLTGISRNVLALVHVQAFRIMLSYNVMSASCFAVVDPYLWVSLSWLVLLPASEKNNIRVTYSLRASSL